MLWCLPSPQKHGSRLPTSGQPLSVNCTVAKPLGEGGNWKATVSGHPVTPPCWTLSPQTLTTLGAVSSYLNCPPHTLRVMCTSLIDCPLFSSCPRWLFCCTWGRALILDVAAKEPRTSGAPHPPETEPGSMETGNGTFPSCDAKRNRHWKPTPPKSCTQCQKV